MDEPQTTPGLKDELASLRDEIRRLREAQEQSRQSDRDGQQKQGNHNEQGQEPRGQDETKEEGQAKEQGQVEEQSQDQQKTRRSRRPSRRRKPFIIAGVIVLVLAMGIWWLYARQFENTDDATVDGHTSGISSRIAGIVVAVYEEEDQFVKAAQVVVDLDPRDYQVALDQARGQLLQAEKQALAERPNVPLTVLSNQTNIAVSQSALESAEDGVAAAERNYQAAVQKLHESEANNEKAQTDVERYRPLVEKDEVPRDQFDQVVANAKALAATVAASQESARAAQKQVEQSREQLVQARQRAEETLKNSPRQIASQRATLGIREAGLETARAQLEQSELNLSYCKIITPVNGIVAKRMAEVGQHVTPGQQVMLVTQLDDLWVTANFRETQLRNMREGQSVRIHVDELNTDFDGYVENMPATSGAITSLLPPENATGNFVKIVQRLPVRIGFKKGQDGMIRLRPGMSVEPKVRVR